MTDITDQDRRAARAWAKNWQGDQDDDTSAAARVILATVDAPAPAVSEELRGQAEWARGIGAPDHAEKFDALAFRAEQIEQENEAQQEWNLAVNEQAGVLARERDEAKKERDHFFREVENVRTWKEQLLNERDEARVEVERLTAERLDRNPGTKARVKAALNNLDQVEKVAVQKGAESNAETPDPADVPPGEAWIVECRGERRTAVKDRDDNNEPWNTFNADGWYLSEDNEDITLVSRLVPAPRVITNADDLDRAKRCTVILDSVGVVCERASLGDGWFTTRIDTDQTPYIELPVTVIWEPGA